MDNKEKVQKYMSIYMSLGMCFGVSGGLLFGLILFPDNIALGMCLGMPIGMSIGMVIGSAKDKSLSENMMEVSRIEDVQDSKDKLLYAIDKKGVEKEYKVTESQMKNEKFSVGDRVAEETDGSLVSLESR
ncbi:MAG: hypothetical protein IJD40_01185 [Lachnospiraceae bacterium]|nr:hypothetical protein [Lachnospiraceae bacterium]